MKEAASKLEMIVIAVKKGKKGEDAESGMEGMGKESVVGSSTGAVFNFLIKST